MKFSMLRQETRRMDKPLVVIPNPVHPDVFEELKPRFRLIGCEEFDRDQKTALAQADAVIPRSFKMPKEILEACPRLKVIARHGAGVDSVDMTMASRLGIVVANVPGGNGKSVAEATVALMLGAIWRIPVAHGFVTSGQFERRWELHFEQLTDRVLGLVGLGNIGTRVAHICGGGFDMKVFGYDPFVDRERMALIGVEKVDDLETLLRAADVVSLHLPLTAETHHLIGEYQLRLMKKRAVLVNAARGKLVDGRALCRALEEGWIAGAGLDVFEIEPPAPDDPLLRAANLVMAPHSASLSIEADRNVGLACTEIVIDAFAGQQPKNFINREVWSTRRT
jgi:D-3-phosphoglycerate dehydrogenase / 2-oxoglutarate reductase